jgi:Ca-activated chloride channel family protein
MPRLLAVFLVAAGLTFSPADCAQPNIRVDTTLVVVPVSVSDAQNRFVLGLDKGDFKLFEDGAEQNVKQFAGEDAPISVGLLVDVSGSMGTKVDLSRAAVKQLLKTLDAQDEAALVEFGDKAELDSPFSPDTARILDKLAHVEPQGLTALLDAVGVGLQEMKNAKNTRKALIIISDGGDNHSRYTTEQIKDLVRQADVQVYSMGVYERFPAFAMSVAEITGPRLLRELSDQTGGRAFSASIADELPAIATRIGIELRNQYVLAYTPANRKKDGSYRKLRVDVKTPSGLPPLKARWRQGYYAPWN